MQKPLSYERQGFVIELNSILSQTLQKYRSSGLSNYIRTYALYKITILCINVNTLFQTFGCRF
jgi:hypothetical protein